MALSYLVKMDGGAEGGGSRFSGINQTNLELSHIKTDSSYCRAGTRNFECEDRLPVQKCEGLERMGTEQGNLPKSLHKPRLRNEHSKLDSSSRLTRVISDSKKGGSSTVTKLIMKTSGMESFRKKVIFRRNFKKSFRPISKERKMGTNSNITNRPEESLIFGVVKDRLIPRCDITLILDFLASIFD